MIPLIKHPRIQQIYNLKKFFILQGNLTELYSYLFFNEDLLFNLYEFKDEIYKFFPKICPLFLSYHWDNWEGEEEYVNVKIGIPIIYSVDVAHELLMSFDRYWINCDKYIDNMLIDFEFLER